MIFLTFSLKQSIDSALKMSIRLLLLSTLLLLKWVYSNLHIKRYIAKRTEYLTAI